MQDFRLPNHLRPLTLKLPLLVIALSALLSAQVQTGTVRGTVLDGQTGRPITGASVNIEGESVRTETSSSGEFSMAVAGGTYRLLFTAPNYLDRVVERVVVTAGQLTEASTVMTNKSSSTRVEVVARADAIGATAEAMLVERRLASTVSDAISQVELAAGTSSDAAGALEKVTGVSVVGEGFVYVRGLGERYSATMLNGAVIPTTEPEKRVVPLDLFPTGLIENIRIVKSYTPDLPAEFSGGLVEMSTIAFPAERTLRVSTKTGYNTRTTRKPFLTYPGGAYDFFGFSDSSYDLPSSIPTNARLFPGQFTPNELQNFGRAFSDNWQPASGGVARLPADWSAVGGGTFGRFGIVGALTFSNSPQYQSEQRAYYRQGGQGAQVFTDYPDFREYGERARLGAVFNVAAKLSRNHELVLRNTLTHDTDKTSREFSGYDGTFDSNTSSERLRWVERSLYSMSLEGNHSFPGLHGSSVRWQFTRSISKRYEPDLREVFRELLPDGRYIFSANGSSGVRFFSDLNDHIYEPQVDYSIPFFKGSFNGLFKVGYRGTLRDRDFQARRFRYIPQQLSTLDLFLPSNELFAPANIRPSGFQIVEYTRGTDRYSAQMDVHAGYAMADLGLGSRLRIIGGARVEASDIQVTTVDNLVPQAAPTTATLQNTDPVPGVNVIYALAPRQNLRFSYSRTLSRPDFRELSPFDFNDVLGGFVVQGNPNLKRATVSNYDARWEWFPGGSQVVAASVFAKQFTNPIEQTILAANDLRESFVNARAARNIGLELEVRKDLGFLRRALRQFSVSSNFTFVDSNIQIRPEDVGVLTSTSRPLLGQSRYVGNGMLEWAKPKWHCNARFYANYVSRRIADVGTFRLPDIYQEANTTLDFIYQYSLSETSRWSLRFEAENLGDSEFRWTQQNKPQRSYQVGRTFQVGVSYRIF